MWVATASVAVRSAARHALRSAPPTTPLRDRVSKTALMRPSRQDGGSGVCRLPLLPSRDSTPYPCTVHGMAIPLSGSSEDFASIKYVTFADSLTPTCVNLG